MATNKDIFRQILDENTLMSCRVATTEAVTRSGLQTIDGVSLSTGDRILVKDQINKTIRGIYQAATGTWSRVGDMDDNDDLLTGALVLVLEGETNGDTLWKITFDGSLDIGTTEFDFVSVLQEFTSREQFESTQGVTSGAQLISIAQTLYLSTDGTESIREISHFIRDDDLDAASAAATSYDGYHYRPLGRPTPLHYGARGMQVDGSHLLLSDVFASSGDAQAVYPKATDGETEALDWAAFQKMIDANRDSTYLDPELTAAAARNKHAGWWLPKGIFYLNKTLDLTGISGGFSATPFTGDFPTLVFDTPGEFCIDCMDSQRIIFDGFTILGRLVNGVAPKAGLFVGRAADPTADPYKAPPAPFHVFGSGLTIKGKFGYAAHVNFASEECQYNRPFFSNAIGADDGDPAGSAFETSASNGTSYVVIFDGDNVFGWESDYSNDPMPNKEESFNQANGSFDARHFGEGHGVFMSGVKHWKIPQVYGSLHGANAICYHIMYDQREDIPGLDIRGHWEGAAEDRDNIEYQIYFDATGSSRDVTLRHLNYEENNTFCTVGVFGASAAINSVKLYSPEVTIHETLHGNGEVLFDSGSKFTVIGGKFCMLQDNSSFMNFSDLASFSGSIETELLSDVALPDTEGSEIVVSGKRHQVNRSDSVVNVDGDFFDQVWDRSGSEACGWEYDASALSGQGALYLTFGEKRYIEFSDQAIRSTSEGILENNGLSLGHDAFPIQRAWIGRIDFTGYGICDPNGNKVIDEQQSPIDNLVMNYTSNTPSFSIDGAVTFADGSAPTNSELLEAFVEVSTKLNTLLAAQRAHGLIAT